MLPGETNALKNGSQPFTSCAIYRSAEVLAASSTEAESGTEAESSTEAESHTNKGRENAVWKGE